MPLRPAQSTFVGLDPLEPRRLLAAAGELDSSFDGDGKVVTDWSAYSDDGVDVAVASDGGIVAAVRWTNKFSLIKYTPAGAIDESFGTAGKVTSTLDTYAGPNAMALQADGKILLAGADFAGTSPGSSAVIMRFTATGLPDSSFDTDGIVNSSPGTQHSWFEDILVQPDGKILAVGVADPGLSGNDDFFIARFNADGSPDNTFDGDGRRTIDLGLAQDDTAYGVALQSDGKIIVVGSRFTGSSYVSGVLRLNGDGSNDNTFDTDGRAVEVSGMRPTAVAIDTSGRIVIGGTRNNFYAAARFTTGGAFDNSFGGDGVAEFAVGVTPPSANWSLASDLKLDPAGRIVIVGEARTGTGFTAADMGVLRVLPNGWPDPRFGGGLVLTDFGASPSAAERARAIDFDADGRLVVVGQQWHGNDRNDIILARYHDGPTEPYIVGHVFDDYHGDGVNSGGLNDAPAAGQVVYIDADNSNSLSPGEVSTTTDAAGDYVFENLSPGTYRVRMALANGWMATTPVFNFTDVTVAAGQGMAAIDFGRKQFAFIDANRTLVLRDRVGADRMAVNTSGGQTTFTIGAASPSPTFATADYDVIVFDSLGGVGDSLFFGGSAGGAVEYVMSQGSLGDSANVAVGISAGVHLTFTGSPWVGSLFLGATGGLVTMAGEAQVLRTAALTHNGGTLDLGSSSLIVDYASTSPVGVWTGNIYDGLAGMIKAGRIMSSEASGTFKHLAVAEARDALGIAAAQTAAFAGHTVDSTTALVKFTWGGDANLDGKINIDDYGQIDFNVSKSGAVYGYFAGDFNLDGKINIDDYGIIDFNVTAQEGIL